MVSSRHPDKSQLLVRVAYINQGNRSVVIPVTGGAITIGEDAKDGSFKLEDLEEVDLDYRPDSFPFTLAPGDAKSAEVAFTFVILKWHFSQGMQVPNDEKFIGPQLVTREFLLGVRAKVMNNMGELYAATVDLASIYMTPLGFSDINIYQEAIDRSYPMQLNEG